MTGDRHELTRDEVASALYAHEAGDGSDETSLPRVERSLKNALDDVSNLRQAQYDHSPEERTKQMSLRSLSPSD